MQVYPKYAAFSHRELADVIVGPHSVNFQQSREIQVEWNLSNVVPFFKMGKKEELWSLLACQSHLNAW